MLQYEKIVGRHVELGIVDARRQILERGEDDRAPFLFEQLGIGGRPLKDRALRRERAEQRDEAALSLQRLGQGAHNFAVDRPAGRVEALAEGLTGDSRAVEMEEGFQL